MNTHRLNDGVDAKFTAAAATDPGAFVQIPDGRAGLVVGTMQIGLDAVGTAQTTGEVYVDDADVATGFDPAVGDIAWHDDDSGELVGEGSADADWPVGRVVRAPDSAGENLDLILNDFGSEAGALTLASVAASTAVTDTTVETAYDVVHEVEAGTLKAGDVLRVTAQVKVTGNTGTPNLTTLLNFGGVEVASTGAVAVVAGDIVVIRGELVVRTVGASGTIVAAGFYHAGTEATATVKAFDLPSATLDTTADMDLEVTAEWSAADAANIAQLEILNLERVR